MDKRKENNKNYTKKYSEEHWTTNTVIEKDTFNPSEPKISVITKTRKPKVIIQSEEINNENYTKQYKWENEILIIIILIIVLATFLLSITNYNMLSELISSQQ